MIKTLIAAVVAGAFLAGAAPVVHADDKAAPMGDKSAPMGDKAEKSKKEKKDDKAAKGEKKDEKAGGW